MPFIKVEDPSKNIFKTHPHIEVLSLPKKLKEEYGEERASKILTAAYLIFSPDSNLRDSGLDEEELVTDVNENYLEEPSFDWDDFEDVVLFIRKNISKAKTMLLEYEERLIERDKFLKEWTWDKKTAKNKNAVMKDTKGLWDDYLEIKARVDEEKTETSSFGNYSKSLLEKYGSKG